MSPNTSRVLSVILGGGAGTRLFPLTKERAKPAVPLAGKYRLVDIPISNCINSDLRRVYLLTQFNSASLHRHVAQSYKFDHFSDGFVEILAAEQTHADTSWYQGTADAVRKNLVHLLNHDFDHVLILSGDQLYRMDFRHLIAQHIETDAEVTVATIPVNRREAPGLGIIQIDRDRRITRFVEKPKDPAVQDSLTIPPDLYEMLGITGAGEDLLLASMGIYLFNREVLIKLLENTLADFGKHIIPGAIETHRVSSYVFQGYWEDIGTIRAFYEANLDLCEPLPQFNFYDASAPIFTHARYLPATKIIKSTIERSVIADGCIINDAHIDHSLLGVRSRVQAGATIRDSLVMGQDFYDSPERIPSPGAPTMGIGHGASIERTIVDKNARIGDDVRITPDGKPAQLDGPNYYVRDGLVIIPKNAVVMSGTEI